MIVMAEAVNKNKAISYDLIHDNIFNPTKS